MLGSGSARLVLARLGSIRLASLIELTNIGSGSARLINELLNGTRARLGLETVASWSFFPQSKTTAKAIILGTIQWKEYSTPIQGDNQRMNKKQSKKIQKATIFVHITCLSAASATMGNLGIWPKKQQDEP
ncbi:hypothetical protein LXL04_031039 [Taraxacum kok-saghyz]